MRALFWVAIVLLGGLHARGAGAVPPGGAKHGQGFEDESIGFAGDPQARNVVLLGHRANQTSTSDVWGYVDAQGGEYAIVGAQDGTAILDVTDPFHPEQVAFIPGVSSRWRDMKTLGHHLYIVSDSGGGGMQIVDIVELPARVELVGTYVGFLNAHNLFIDTDRALAYVVGTRIGNGGVRILDLSEPSLPEEIGAWDVHTVHDIHVNGNTAYAFSPGFGVDIIDVTDPSAPKTLNTITYNLQAFTHSGFVTPDGNTLVVCDEFDELLSGFDNTRLLFFRREGPGFNYVRQRGYTGPNGAIDHNVFLTEDFAFLSNYTYGLTVVDIRDISNPKFFGNYDTFRPDNDKKFSGAWGVYPYLPSGRILVSDIDSGLYVFALDLDGDGLAPIQEEALGTDPNLKDSDGDGVDDGDEVLFGLNPAVADAGIALPAASLAPLLLLVLALGVAGRHRSRFAHPSLCPAIRPRRARIRRRSRNPVGGAG